MVSMDDQTPNSATSVSSGDFEAMLANCGELAGNLFGEHRGRLSELQATLQQFAEEIESASAEADPSAQEEELLELSKQLRDARQTAAEATEKAAITALENAELANQLSAATAASDTTSSFDAAELEELRDRHEMAMFEIHQLKEANQDLTDRLEKASNQAASDSPDAPSSGAMDWESQKQRMLDELNEFDEADKDQVEARLSIEETIRTTQRAIANKDEELAELRKLLADQSSSIGGMAVGANAIAEMLDGDELIRDEREHLKKLQDEWREKLRVAEVDLSVERAKLARDRSALEDKIQQLASENAKWETLTGATKKGEKPTRNKWLARLGIQDDE